MFCFYSAQHGSSWRHRATDFDQCSHTEPIWYSMWRRRKGSGSMPNDLPGWCWGHIRIGRPGRARGSVFPCHRSDLESQICIDVKAQAKVGTLSFHLYSENHGVSRPSSLRDKADQAKEPAAKACHSDSIIDRRWASDRGKRGSGKAGLLIIQIFAFYTTTCMWIVSFSRSDAPLRLFI